MKTVKPFISVGVIRNRPGHEYIALIDKIIDFLPEVSSHFEVILIETGNRSAEAPEIEKALKRWTNVRYFHFKQPVNKEEALVFAISQAIGEWICILTEEGEPVPALQTLLEKLHARPGLHIGIRNELGISFLHRAMGRTFYSFGHNILGLEFVPFPSGTIGLDRESAARLSKIPFRMRYLKGLMNPNTLQAETFLVDEKASRSYKSRGVFSSIDLGLDIIVFNSVRPLRWIT